MHLSSFGPKSVTNAGPQLTFFVVLVEILFFSLFHFCFPNYNQQWYFAVKRCESLSFNKISFTFVNLTIFTRSLKKFRMHSRHFLRRNYSQTIQIYDKYTHKNLLNNFFFHLFQNNHMLVVASTKFSIISLINSGRANLFLPILSPKKGILLELPKARHNLIENQGKKRYLVGAAKS